MEDPASDPVVAEESRLVHELMERNDGPAAPLSSAAAAAAAAERQRWLRDAYSLLKAHGGQHWWCQHGDLTSGMSVCGGGECRAWLSAAPAPL